MTGCRKLLWSARRGFPVNRSIRRTSLLQERKNTGQNIQNVVCPNNLINWSINQHIHKVYVPHSTVNINFFVFIFDITILLDSLPTMHNALISARDSVHVKFGPSVCVVVVASSWNSRQWQILLLSMVCVPWQNIKSAMHARSGSPPSDILVLMWYQVYIRRSTSLSFKPLTLPQNSRVRTQSSKSWNFQCHVQSTLWKK